LLRDIFWTVVFILGVYYLLHYFVSIKKATDIAKDALFPTTDDEYRNILIPMEWKEMEPLTKHTKSYHYVKWGTMLAIILLIFILGIVLSTDWLDSSLFSVGYLFVFIITAIKHRGNIFILTNGFILNGRFYTYQQLKNYQVEKIIRWSELYGLDSRVDNGYKITFMIKNRPYRQNFVVIRNELHLKRLTDFLAEKGISEKSL
jgi:hypothetical protein